MAGNLRLDFNNLPLVEAAIRASFAQAVDLKFSAISELHERLRESFPHVTEPQHYEAAPGITEEVKIGPGHISGVVFSGSPEGLRSTLQSRVAIVRWLKQFVGDAPNYPRFSVLRATLWKVIEAVKAAYGLESLPIAVVNMSYVNFIQVTDFSSVLSLYFSPLVNVQATNDAEEISKLEVAWRERGIDLRFRLEKVSATLGEDTTDGCRLTTIAGMRVPATDGDAKKALDDIHARLQMFFRDVISEHAKQEWQLKEVDNG